mmetsp:Transcript_76586/g.135238  ORF Transcript_76586/g.135238 Transcript_76586/m.135238 type:complete len:90 (+) Transcript_76586:990-1259(+)
MLEHALPTSGNGQVMVYGSTVYVVKEGTLVNVDSFDGSGCKQSKLYVYQKKTLHPTVARAAGSFTNCRTLATCIHVNPLTLPSCPFLLI